MHYPFHPLHQQCLEVVAWPRPGRLAVTVQQPDGGTLKIPLWRIEPTAAQRALCDQVELTASVLLGLGACGSEKPIFPPNDPLDARRTTLTTLVPDIPLSIRRQRLSFTPTVPRRHRTASQCRPRIRN